jgi:hypothetical protein
MQNPARKISAALLVFALGACGDPTGAGPARFDTNAGGATGTGQPAAMGGGTYGSGGNLIPGGGTYGSGGKAAADSGGSGTATEVSGTTAECPESEERGGGTYGSGGRVAGCVTEPTP